MPRAPVRQDACMALAARPQGVTNAELAVLWDCDFNNARNVLQRCEMRRGMVRARVPGQALRFFASAALRDQWLARELATLQATGRAMLRTQAQRVQDARASLQASLPPKAAQPSATRRKAAAAPTPPAPQTPQPVGPGVLFDSSNAARKAAPGVSGRGPGITAITPARQTPAGWADAPAVITPATKITVYTRPPQRGDRVDTMAAPMPGVPGWGRPAPLREGALDYRRHQHHSGPRVTLCGAEGRTGGRP